MAKVYTEKEVIERLRKEIEANKPLFCPNCGCGLTAKLQAMGGADVICVSATSYWRLKGQGSLAPLMPYSNINEVIMSIVPEVVLNAGDVPVVTLSGGTNPLLPHRKHLEMLTYAMQKGGLITRNEADFRTLYPNLTIFNPISSAS